MNDDFYKEIETADGHTDETSKGDMLDKLKELREKIEAIEAACEEMSQACDSNAEAFKDWDELLEREKDPDDIPPKKKDAPRKIGDVRHAAGAGRPLCRARNREQRTARVA